MRRPSEDQQGRRDLSSWIVRVITQQQSERVFTPYGEVSENNTFLSCRSQKQTCKHNQIGFLCHLAHGKEEKDQGQ